MTWTMTSIHSLTNSITGTDKPTSLTNYVHTMIN